MIFLNPLTTHCMPLPHTYVQKFYNENRKLVFSRTPGRLRNCSDVTGATLGRGQPLITLKPTHYKYKITFFGKFMAPCPLPAAARNTVHRCSEQHHFFLFSHLLHFEFYFFVFFSVKIGDYGPDFAGKVFWQLLMAPTNIKIGTKISYCPGGQLGGAGQSPRSVFLVRGF